ncbi:unnamed protein product [Ectocarpus sp. CCAP 1310/34]|nr:unnamed protein product [Ectocarpus sp. CCAP 1310/34]
MPAVPERIETTIFRGDTKKTIVSAIMDLRVVGGLGDVMMNVARDLTLEMKNFGYTGRCLLGDPDSDFQHNIQSYQLEACFNIFGGCAYQVHAMNDKSRFAHILPGLHDVDVRGSVKLVGGKDGKGRCAQPFERISIDQLFETQAPNPLDEPGVLAHVLKKICTIVRRRLLRSDPPLRYDRHINDNPFPDRVDVLHAPVSSSRRPGVLHEEVVGDHFLLVIVDEVDLLKVQVEVRAKLGSVVGVDHVFELIFPVEDWLSDGRCEPMEHIGGLFVPPKKELFFQNMTSGIERARLSRHATWLADKYHAVGKCAQDVLRLTYIILTDLDAEKSWVNTPAYDDVVAQLPRTHELNLAAGRYAWAFHKQTPIEYFAQYMKYMAPCIERSRVGTFGLGEDDKFDHMSNHGAPVFLREILELFTSFTEGSPMNAALEAASDRVRDVGMSRNRAVGPDLHPLRVWETHVENMERARAARLRRIQDGNKMDLSAEYGPRAQPLVYCLPDEAFKGVVRPLIEHGAARGEQSDVLGLLPALGEDGGLGYRGERDRTLLQAAARGGCDEVIRALLQTDAKHELNLSFPYVYSPLFYAVQYCVYVEPGSDKAAFALIEAGADCKYCHRGGFEKEMIQFAVEAGNVRLVRTLLEGGAPVDAFRGHDGDPKALGRTPLQIACREGMGPEMVQLLLEWGATATGGDCYALSDTIDEYFRSREKSSLDTIDLLLKYGSDPKEGLDRAWRDVVILEKLIDGVDVNDISYCWDFPLNEAASKGTPATIRLLVENGADSNLMGRGGFTPLANAVRNGMHENARALLCLGARVDDQCLGLTPLLIACQRKLLEEIYVADLNACISVLVGFGADVEALSHDGKTIGQLIDGGNGSDAMKPSGAFNWLRKISLKTSTEATMDLIENMHGATIRVDKNEQVGSVIDTIRMVLGGDSSAANTSLNRLILANEELGTRCTQLRINGKGKFTPVADAKTLIEIVWLLPGKKAREFRRQSSEKVCRLLGGDLSLVSEIEARHATLQSTEQGRATQEFLLGEREEAVETFDGMPAGFRYLPVEDRAQFAKQMLELNLEMSKVALKRKRVDDMVQSYRALQDLGVLLDGRTLIELRDNVTILSRQDVMVNNAVAIAAPLLHDSTTPTHELGADQRGKETGIVVVSSKIGIRVPQNMSGTVGKMMKQMYIRKYELAPDFSGFARRQTLFNGRPILENLYFERDEDIIEEAIRAVMKSPAKPRQSIFKWATQNDRINPNVIR